MKKNTLYYHSTLDVGKDGNVGVVDRAYMQEAAAEAEECNSKASPTIARTLLYLQTCQCNLSTRNTAEHRS